MSGIAVVAPHPDDETLGCGGVLLRARAAGRPLHWILVTRMEGAGYTTEQVAARDREIAAVADAYGFTSVSALGFPAARLDIVPLADVVGAVGCALDRAGPEELYVPWRGDAHSDHRVTFDASAACAKWFRRSGLRRVLAYETISETGFALGPAAAPFVPNVFADVTPHMERKLEVLALYAGETAPHPFPRSAQSCRALASLRGAAGGCEHAEAFVLLRERC